MENLSVTVINENISQSDNEIISPYYPAEREEQEDRVAGTIRKKNGWKKDECESYSDIISSE